MSQASDDSVDPSVAVPGLPKDSRIALCLSGGGFRAALFHLGAFRRLNELGILSTVDSIASVSGGSILAAVFWQAIWQLVCGRGRLVCRSTSSAVESHEARGAARTLKSRSARS